MLHGLLGKGNLFARVRLPGNMSLLVQETSVVNARVLTSITNMHHLMREPWKKKRQELSVYRAGSFHLSGESSHLHLLHLSSVYASM